MKKFFKTLRKDSVLLWSFWISFLLIIIAAVNIAVFYSNLPPVIPLYNHMPWGYDRLGKRYELFILPAITLIIVFLNSLLGIRMLAKIPLLARFLFLTMVTLTFFMLIFIVRIIFVTL